MESTYDRDETITEKLDTLAADLLRDHRFQLGVRRLCSQPQATWQNANYLWRGIREYENYFEESGLPAYIIEGVTVLWITGESFPKNDTLVAFYSAAYRWYCINGCNRERLENEVVLHHLRIDIRTYSAKIQSIIYGPTGFISIILPHDTHPLEMAFRSSFDLNNALEVIDQAEIRGFDHQIDYIRSRKKSLDALLSTTIHAKYTDDAVVDLLHKFIEKRLNDYEEEMRWLSPHYPGEHEGMGNILSKRQTLEGLIHTLRFYGGVQTYQSRLEQADIFLKSNAPTATVMENTPKNRLLALVPPSRWWWYRENYL